MTTRKNREGDSLPEHVVKTPTSDRVLQAFNDTVQSGPAVGQTLAETALDLYLSNLQAGEDYPTHPSQIDPRVIVLLLAEIQELQAENSQLRQIYTDQIFEGEQERNLKAALAKIDVLTGVRTRAAFNEDFPSALEQAKNEGKILCLVNVDFDGVKGTNDTYGHFAGDSLIKEGAKTLESGIRREDRVYRIGGDEFLILAFAEPDGLIENLNRACHHMQSTKLRTKTNAGQYFDLDMKGFSFGCHPCDPQLTIEENIQAADTLMYANKAARKAATPTSEAADEYMKQEMALLQTLNNANNTNTDSFARYATGYKTEAGAIPSITITTDPLSLLKQYMPK